MILAGAIHGNVEGGGSAKHSKVLLPNGACETQDRLLVIRGNVSPQDRRVLVFDAAGVAAYMTMFDHITIRQYKGDLPDIWEDQN